MYHSHIHSTLGASIDFYFKHRYVPIRLKEYPAILGCDGAGVIESVGSDVKDFKKGDRV